MNKLIISIVPHNSGEFITSTACEAGAGGGSILMGRGTASNSIIQLLGLGDTSKDIVYIIVDDLVYDKVYEAIKNKSLEKKASFGVMFTINLTEFFKGGSSSPDKDEIQEKDNPNSQGDSMYRLINIIVNKGYADDAMAAARKAGAGGGTIIGARGTAKEGDAKFLGVEIVPEKDMLMIVVPEEKADDVVKAVKSLPCLEKAGSGIVFCSDAQNFTLLGKKASE